MVVEKGRELSSDVLLCTLNVLAVRGGDAEHVELCCVVLAAEALESSQLLVARPAFGLPEYEDERLSRFLESLVG